MKITGGYNLKARFVIRTVGPVYKEMEQNRLDLMNCYRDSLDLARQHDIHSIAFHAISTGVYGYPKSEAANVVV